jgi:hypothetical protein
MNKKVKLYKIQKEDKFFVKFSYHVGYKLNLKERLIDGPLFQR